MATQKHGYGYATLALIFLSLVWGYNWVMLKVALEDAGPIEFATLRSVLGALSLLALLPLLGKPLRPREIPGTLLLGLLQTTGFIGLVMWALVSGGAGKTAVLVYTMPFWVIILAWPLLGERIHGAQWFPILLALAGLILILKPWVLHSSLTSDVLAILAGVCWAASVIVAKKLRHRTALDLLSLTAWQMLFGSVPLVVIALWIPEPTIHWTGAFIAALLFNVLPANALAWLLWLYVLHKLPAGIAGLGTLAIPIIGVLAAWLQLGERPGRFELAGVVLIVIALALISRHTLRQQRNA